MLNNRTAFYEDYEKNNKFFYHEGKQHYTNNTIQQLELELENGTILDKTTDTLHEQRRFYEQLYSSWILNMNTIYELEYEKEFFPHHMIYQNSLIKIKINYNNPSPKKKCLQH